MKIKIKQIMFLWFILFFSFSFAQISWDGKWYTYWKSGVFVLNLEQNGSEVNGSFEPGNGTLTGKINNHTLVAKTITENHIENQISITMSDSRESFFGKTYYGNWITGTRVNANSKYNDIATNRSSPLKTFYSFLSLGNSVRAGNYEILEKAMDLLAFNKQQGELRHPAKLALTQSFFNIIDECVVNKLDFFKTESIKSNSIVLYQLGSDVTVSIDFIEDKKSGMWKIQLPESTTLNKKLKVLLAARDKYEVDPNANLDLSTPRATIRTFYEQYDRWEEGGKKFAISTLNLSEIDPAIHEWQAALLAYYMKSVLDRISHVVYQEVPNDPKSKKPYVHFYHPVANIVISPYMVDGKTKWKFTPQTLTTIDELYTEMKNVKALHPTKKIKENNLYFGLKSSAEKISPLLLKQVKHTEVWQVIMLLFIISFAIFMSFIIRYIIMYLFKNFYLTKRWTSEMITMQYIKPMQLTTFSLVTLYGAHQLGLSNVIFSMIKSFTHLLIVIGITWILYNLITIIFSILQIHAKKTSTDIDEIILSLAGSILRILVITAAVFIVAEIFSIPYKTVVAGLGIGGLAFAIAAKDTIANFFGSAIIIADRPFKRGDKVKIGENIGVIADVGIRSTKIRTIYDTLLTVPNNKITQEMIDNYSEREAMRIDTEFFLALDTSKELLDKIDMEISEFLRENAAVDSSKIILTGVNDYTKRGISFGVSFFVKTTTVKTYSERRHQIITDLAQIIKTNKIEMIMISGEIID